MPATDLQFRRLFPSLGWQDTHRDRGEGGMNMRLYPFKHPRLTTAFLVVNNLKCHRVDTEGLKAYLPNRLWSFLVPWIVPLGKISKWNPVLQYSCLRLRIPFK